MPQQANLEATTRTNTGKGAARSLRRQGKIPCVIYGHNRAAEPVVVDTAALNKMLVGISAGTTVLDVVVDRSSVEVFANEGEAALSSLAFGRPGANGLSVESVGGSTRLASFELAPLAVAPVERLAERGAG